jgi:hypothetical protein
MTGQVDASVTQGWTGGNWQRPDPPEGRERRADAYRETQNGRPPAQGGAQEIIHQRIRLHHLPAQTLPCEELKIRSKEIQQLRLQS